MNNTTNNATTSESWNASSGWRMDPAARVLSDKYIAEVRANLSTFTAQTGTPKT